MPDQPDKLPTFEPPRPPRRDDRHGIGRPGPTLGNGKLLLYLSINATVCMLGCGGLGAGVYSALVKPAAERFRQVDGRIRADLARQEKERAASERVWRKPELDAAVRGRTPAQVVELLGRPDVASDHPLEADGSVFTYWGDRLTNEATGRGQGFSIYFHDGRATGTGRGPRAAKRPDEAVRSPPAPTTP